MKRNKQSGFTLVELVVVIAVLGVLAASALPRFVNVQSNARIAIGQGLAAALKSGSTLARSSWIAAGSDRNQTSVIVDGRGVSVNTNNGNTLGYPLGVDYGIGNVLENLDTTKYRAEYAYWTATFIVDGRENCRLTYNATTGAVDTSRLTVGNCS